MMEGKNLAINRRKQLVILLKEHFFSYCLISLFTSLFIIPLFVWLFLASYAELFNGTSFYSTLFTYLCALPLFILMGLGFAGLDYYLQKQVFGDGVSFPGTFFEGISKSFKTYLLSFFLIWLITLLFKFTNSYMASLALEDEASYIRVIVLGVTYFLYFFFLFLFLRSNIESLTYKGSYFTHLRNSLIFSFGKPHISLGVSLISYIPLILFESIPLYESQMILLFISAFFYSTFGELLMVLSSDSLFDMTINKDYPEIYRKGLREIEKTE